MAKAEVFLFRKSGKYYTEEEWEIPTELTDTRADGTEYTREAIGPYDMIHSPNFRRIDGGPVLVITQEPWGFPCLLMPE